ncbi:hypothetical protein [Mucilaginibacter dorajii]|uniref:Uncharacterized protein n=1 Tax=Mucilaginibacter dorajii TaxID=692994 RepID=A0ABP7P6E2_9SPHI|nr:hypothetical protein [Mucilaginibacter dorajii]MCS3734581.1 hypothetical protein [Mucilaginibacter dorajii]
MTLTINLWTKTSKFYKVGLCITVITFSSVALLAYLNPHSVPISHHDRSLLEVLFDISLGTCGIFSALFLVLVVAYNIGKYHNDGELVLADDYLIIDNIKIPLDQIKYINLKISPRNPKTLVLGKNLITLGDVNGNQYMRKFVITSYLENEDFEKKLSLWRARGVGIYAYYNGI